MWATGIDATLSVQAGLPDTCTATVVKVALQPQRLNLLNWYYGSGCFSL